MSEEKGVNISGIAKMPGLKLEAYIYESCPIESLCLHIEGERKRIFSPDQDPNKVIDWLKTKGEEFGASNVALRILERARQYVEGKEITNQPKYDEYIIQARDHIQEKIVAEAVPKIQHGQIFKDSRRGKGKVTALVDEELEKIILEIGLDAKVYDPEDREGKTVFKKIEIMVEAEVGHPVFEDVGLDAKKEPYILARNPKKLSQKKDFTVSAIQKRLAPIRRKILGKG